MDLTDNIKITDKRGFIYEVIIKHSPRYGFSTAYYNDKIIAQSEYGRLLQPVSDDDKEQEWWEERLNEWKDAAVSDLLAKGISIEDIKKLLGI